MTTASHLEKIIIKFEFLISRDNPQIVETIFNTNDRTQVVQNKSSLLL
jgi:hypothetical protein